MKHYKKKLGPGPSSPKQATSYYISRIEWLKSFTESTENKSGYFYMDSEELIESPKKTLANLSRFLRLYPPLHPQYQTGALTGLPGYGDTSKAIAKGVITKNRAADDITYIPEHLVKAAEDAYERSRSASIAKAKQAIISTSHD